MKSVCIADLGCSSGPNTLLVVSYLLEAVIKKRHEHHMVTPEILVFLNDLPGNDFNTLFKNLESFNDDIRKTKGNDLGPCFVAGMPCTFYGRLFPGGTLHFVHSSYSLRWLSKVPEGIEKSNKGNIYISKSSPLSVIEAYSKQFKKDFRVFLKCRSEELVDGGRMVKECCCLWKLLAMALKDMVIKGTVEEEKLDSFPQYFPSPEEVQSVIQGEGSFMVNQLQTFNVNWDGSDSNEDGSSVTDKLRSSYVIARCIRAVSESLLVGHFGEEIIEALFQRYREIVANYATKEKSEHTNLVISVTKGGKDVPGPLHK
ncbi:hypothetical protein MKX01_023755 [Papaver californicum]|nr:hypothetical protein MKX01_023755 [Papaver californicum]